MRAPTWLIGGGSSVGKTTTARTLSGNGRRHVEVDRTFADPISQELATNRAVWQLPSQALCEKLVAKALYLQPRIVEWIMTQTDSLTPTPTMLEGEGIEPAILRDLEPALHVRAVFIVELNQATMRATLDRRSSSYRALDPNQQTAVVAMNLLYNRRIAEEAKLHGQPCLPSQPWDTLVDRVRVALQSDHAT